MEEKMSVKCLCIYIGRYTGLCAHKDTLNSIKEISRGDSSESRIIVIET